MSFPGTLTSTTSGSVTPCPSGQIGHCGKAGVGGVVVTTIGAGDGVAPAGFVVAGSDPGAQPQAVTRNGMISQNCSSMNPACPASCNASQLMGAVSGRSVRSTLPSVTASPSPQMEQSGNPGLGGMGTWAAAKQTHLSPLMLLRKAKKNNVSDSTRSSGRDRLERLDDNMIAAASGREGREGEEKGRRSSHRKGTAFTTLCVVNQ